MTRPVIGTHFSKLFTRTSRFVVFMTLLAFFLFLCVKLMEFLPTEPTEATTTTSEATLVQQLPKPFIEEATQAATTEPGDNVADLEQRIDKVLKNADFNNWIKILGAEMYKLEGDVKAWQLYDSGFSEPNGMLCPEMGDMLRVLILVTSAPEHWKQRRDIRDTWGSIGSRADVTLAFLVGATLNESTQTSLREESATFGDLIRGNSIDSYKNLTLKSLSMLEWTLTYCPMTPYVVKTDDDMFVNTDRLLDFLEEKSDNTWMIFGKIARNWRPNRNLKSKWYLSEETFDRYIFPDFVTGPIYVLTGDTAFDLYTTALDMPFLWLEDVFITGFVAEKLQIPRVEFGKLMQKLYVNNTLPCRLPEFMAVHEVNSTDLHEWWYSLKHPETRANCTTVEEKKAANDNHTIGENIEEPQISRDKLMELIEQIKDI